MKRFFTVLMLFSLFALISCEYETIEVDLLDPNVTVSFSEKIAPIFSSNNCTACHGDGGTPPNLSAGQAYNSIVPGLIDANTFELSRIYVVPAPASNHPGNYTPAQASQVLAWIKQGALNN